jgi:hypothetical protein
MLRRRTRDAETGSPEPETNHEGRRVYGRFRTDPPRYFGDGQTPGGVHTDVYVVEAPPVDGRARLRVVVGFDERVDLSVPEATFLRDVLDEFLSAHTCTYESRTIPVVD